MIKHINTVLTSPMTRAALWFSLGFHISSGPTHFIYGFPTNIFALAAGVALAASHLISTWHSD